jgi:hypothetical protein
MASFPTRLTSLAKHDPCKRLLRVSGNHREFLAPAAEMERQVIRETRIIEVAIAYKTPQTSIAAWRLKRLEL